MSWDYQNPPERVLSEIRTLVYLCTALKDGIWVIYTRSKIQAYASMIIQMDL